MAVTGAGIVTSLGLGWRANADGFRVGRRAFRPVSLFDVSRQRTKVAGEVELPPALPQSRLNSAYSRRLDRASHLLLHAAAEAWEQSQWTPKSDLPMVLGTTSGGMSMGEAYYRQTLATPLNHRRQPRRVMQYQAHRQALDLQQAFGFSGPITIIANACASGANSVGHAFEIIRSGRSTQVLAGGYDALSQLVFAGFDSLQALSLTECRPFDQHRDGLALGEGAAVLTLENLSHAEKRGATILGEVVGYGAATDVHHLTQPHPQGDAALASMSAASASAGIRPSEISYINAHGTGTPLNDSAEAAAINRWAGDSAGKLQVSSTKASIGHLLGAAGTVEAVVCLMAMREQFLPPSVNVQTSDPACSFQIVRNPQSARVEYALTNSFGFGGANATLILRRWS